jgi:hypothetical protein
MGLHTLSVCTLRGGTATIALVNRDATESPTSSFVEVNSMIKLISSKAANGLVTAVAEALSHDIPSMIGPSRSPAAVASVPHFAGGHNSAESRAWSNVRQHSNRPLPELRQHRLGHRHRTDGVRLEDLAGSFHRGAFEGALSGSAFFERFSRAVGVAPMEHLHVQRRIHSLSRTAANTLCAPADGIATHAA